jgi:3-hydroxyisobutyrate dehydrogenase-like beta-hydroxyacid dehydrogenase
MSDVIGFIGLGGMGLGMATRLSSTAAVAVYDVRPERADLVTGPHARAAASVRDIAVPGGTVFTMLPDDRAVLGVAEGPDGLAAQLGAGGLHINTSTVSAEAARRLTELYASTGGQYVAAPVWGRPDKAAEGWLTCALAGEETAKRRARPLLEKLTARIEDFGTEPYRANVAKIAGNFLVAAAIESLAEALAMAEKQGLDRRQLARLLTETAFNCPVYQLYGRLVAEQRCDSVGFTVTLGRKDLRLVRETGAEVDAPMPIANIVENRLITSVARGRAAEDWSALSWVTFEEAGLPHQG